MLKNFFALSSFIGILGGAVLVGTWAINAATDPGHHVPLFVFALGGSMLIQGLFALGYSLGWWSDWGDLAPGALLAGELISGCVALGMIVAGLIHNASTNDAEMVPILAGLIIGINALIGLLLLTVSGKLVPLGIGSGKRGLRA